MLKGTPLATYSACILSVPPLPPIQAIRERHDPAFLRWMPHINIAFPFLEPDSALPLVLGGLGERIGGLSPFRVAFNGF
jgi:2'-5' RNA ligase